MLNEKNIKEAQGNIRNYLRDGLLKKSEIVDRNILETYRKNSEESLRIADHLFKENMSYLWAIVCSYYSMFYIANAVLYNLGYKTGKEISHQVTYDALIVFVREKLKGSLLEDYEKTKDEALEIARVNAEEIIGSFRQERDKRSSFQYDMGENAKHAKAQTSLERAKKFAFEMEKLLNA